MPGSVTTAASSGVRPKRRPQLARERRWEGLLVSAGEHLTDSSRERNRDVGLHS